MILVSLLGHHHPHLLLLQVQIHLDRSLPHLRLNWDYWSRNLRFILQVIYFAVNASKLSVLSSIE